MFYHHQLMPDTAEITLLCVSNKQMSKEIAVFDNKGISSFENHEAALFYKVLDLVDEGMVMNGSEGVASLILNYLNTHNFHDRTPESYTHAIVQSEEMKALLNHAKNKWQEISKIDLAESPFSTGDIMDENTNKMTEEDVSEIHEDTNLFTFIESLSNWANR